MNSDQNAFTDGARALKARIIDEANADARKIEAEALARAAQVTQNAEREAASILMDAETRAQREENEILSKNRTQAELEAKKYSLKLRHSILDNVFQAAYRRIWEIDPRDDRIIRFIYKTMLTEVIGGETVCPSVRHRDAVRIAVGCVNERLAQVGRPPLTMGEIVPDITGGFILKSPTFTKDCSLSAIMDDAREREVIDVAARLFANSAAPAQPKQPAQPVQQAQPVQPAQPVQQTQPAQQAQPAQPQDNG